MHELHEAISGIAVSDLPILLIGEQGTGKEMIARLIHTHQGGRKDTFLKLICSVTVPSSIAQLFVEATRTHGTMQGEIRTIFFDDLCDLSPPNQEALIESLNDLHRHNPADKSTVRLVSATRRSLEADVRTKRFREDLFYRLNGLSLYVPPLRHRKEDIPYLVDFFLTLHRKTLGCPSIELQATTVQALLQHPWPGNVREIEEFAKTALISGELSALAELKTHSPGSAGADTFPAALPLKEATKKASREVERQLILNTLARTRWNRKRAARVLGISYKALLYKLKHIALDETL